MKPWLWASWSKKWGNVQTLLWIQKSFCKKKQSSLSIEKTFSVGLKALFSQTHLSAPEINEQDRLSGQAQVWQFREIRGAAPRWTCPQTVLGLWGEPLIQVGKPGKFPHTPQTEITCRWNAIVIKRDLNLSSFFIAFTKKNLQHQPKWAEEVIIVSAKEKFVAPKAHQSASTQWQV